MFHDDYSALEFTWFYSQLIGYPLPPATYYQLQNVAVR